MENLLAQLDKLHTTELGELRIRKNLRLDDHIDPVNYCKEKIRAPQTHIERKGKNFYATTNTEIITVNAGKCSIITAHPVKK